MTVRRTAAGIDPGPRQAGQDPGFLTISEITARSNWATGSGSPSWSELQNVTRSSCVKY